MNQIDNRISILIASLDTKILKIIIGVKKEYVCIDILLDV